MFETGIRQMRMALALVWGGRLDPRNVERLIKDALKTLEEFGTPGDDVQQLLDGPFAEPQGRNDLQTRALQRTAKRLAQVSPFYGEVFSKAGIEPAKLEPGTMTAVPVTTKADLVARGEDFLAKGVTPVLATRTTGTTGRPAEIWLSRYELELWPAVSALSGVLRNEIGPSDHMQINVSSRATAAVQENLAICRLVGARSRVLGVIPPDESLDGLVGGEHAPTMLATYPSYLALLVRAARRRGLGPDDFRLRRVDCGGEVLSGALERAARETFGVSTVNDTFGMTEVLPVSGRTCGRGHLHHDLNVGFVEVLDLDTGEPAAPGDLGTAVVTPYFPYRECTPVFRYDTRDVVRALPEGQLGCELAATPATSHILGKAEQVVRAGDRVVAPREIVEVCESLPSEPWPARFQMAFDGDRLHVTLPERALDGLTTAEVERRFHAAGIDAQVDRAPGDDPDGRRLRPLRADLLESTFASERQALGAHHRKE